MSNNVLFIHAAILDKCKERLIQYLDVVYEYELINNLKYIYICFVGEDILPINYDDIKKYNKNNNIILLKVSNK